MLVVFEQSISRMLVVKRYEVACMYDSGGHLKENIGSRTLQDYVYFKVDLIYINGT